MKHTAIDIRSPLKTLLKDKAAAKVFARHKIDCITCKGIDQETLLNACIFHGLDPVRLIAEIDAERSGK